MRHRSEVEELFRRYVEHHVIHGKGLSPEDLCGDREELIQPLRALIQRYHRVDETMSTPHAGPGVRSGQTRKRFAQGIAKAGRPESFMFNSAFLPGYSWPDIETALALVGAGGIS